MRLIPAGTALVLTLAHWAAQAQDVAAAQACVRLADDTKRLACFDSAFPSPKSQVSAPSVSGKATPEAEFGDTGQIRRQFAPKIDLPKKLTVRVDKVVPLAGGLYWLGLENGQVWQTTQSDWATTFEAKDNVTISRLALGGYQISVAGNSSSVSVKRLK